MHYQAYAPHAYQLVAVADPDPAKQARARSEYGLGEGQIFDTDLDMMAQPRLSDVAIIATQDKLHLRDIRGLLEKGYDLILEKPVATTLDELREVAGLSRVFPGQMVAVCHVLRHSPFFERLRQIIASGQFGPVVSIQHNENIGYYHFAHSYVRGPWNNEQTSGPLTLTKSCHDMDILLYLLGGASCQSIASVGGLSVFRREHYDPDTMAPMCVDCPQKGCLRLFCAQAVRAAGRSDPWCLTCPAWTRCAKAWATRPMAAACMPATTTWRITRPRPSALTTA